MPAFLASRQYPPLQCGLVSIASRLSWTAADPNRVCWGRVSRAPIETRGSVLGERTMHGNKIHLANHLVRRKQFEVTEIDLPCFFGPALA